MTTINNIQLQDIQDAADASMRAATVLANAVQNIKQPPPPPPGLGHLSPLAVKVKVTYAATYKGDFRCGAIIHNTLLVMANWDSVARSMLRVSSELVVTRAVHDEQVAGDGSKTAHFNIRLINATTLKESSVIHINLIKSPSHKDDRWRYAGFSTGGIRHGETYAPDEICFT
tara:strand:+ start:574 stop:1089 length:516 start_codon:yes stop_codon:yes gene_type:complete